MVWGDIEGVHRGSGRAGFERAVDVSSRCVDETGAPPWRRRQAALVVSGAVALGLIGAVATAAVYEPAATELRAVEAVPAVYGFAGSGGGASTGIVHPRFGPWERWSDAIRHCESRNDPLAVNRSSGAGGLYQITPQTWESFEGYPRAHVAPADVQERFAVDLYRRRGLRPWLASRPCWRPIVEDGAPYPG